MKSYLTIATLVIVGEMVFSLPFHITRFFRPTFLEVFELSNTQLGDIFAIYGVIAMISYFFSGVVADHFSARKLLAISLFATALGGMYLAQTPSQTGLIVLFAYWGFTSIFLFWAALIKATREWGGDYAQGKAFGLLDAGRGLVAAGFASVAVLIFQMFLSSESENITPANQQAAMIAVIYFYSLFTFLAGIMVLIFLPVASVTNHVKRQNYWPLVLTVLSKRVIWLHAIIILCAYCAFKGIDNYGLYVVAVLNLNEVESAQFVSLLAYLRPLAAIAAGVLADRFMTSRLILVMFAGLLCAYLCMMILDPRNVHVLLLYANVMLTAVLIFGLRGIYFALLEEVGTAKYITGISIGLVSIIGFLPDIFFAPIAGRILDASHGVQGFQYYFMWLAFFAVVGLMASFYLRRLILNKQVV